MEPQKNQEQTDNSKSSTQRNLVHMSESYAGPLPHPNHLAAYEKIYPGAAKIIIEMAQSQTSHRQALEKKVITSNVDNERLGMVLTFIGLLVIVIFGFLLIYNNKSIPAGVITMLVPVLAAGVNFYFRKKNEPHELEKKDKQLGPRKMD